MNMTVTSSKRTAAPRHAARQPQRQRGVVLVITLIILVAMTLASVAMIRSVDTSTLIAGNVAFKQSAANSGDSGVEAAIAWLNTNASALEQNNMADGYYATSGDAADLTGNKTPKVATDDMDWSGTGKVRKLGADTIGNDVSYVIHRMCNLAGPLNGATCATDQSSQLGSSQGAGRQMLSYQPGSWDGVSNRGYYRITVRVTGPKNATSFVQAVISR
jgi:type IV pilus assembly protein PilX